LAPGIETTTGPLGQGAATSVGMAIAQKWLAARFNKPGFKIFDYRIYVIMSDGDMMEGISGEAASIAGHLGLNNLIWFYDNNHITIEGNTSLAFSENVRKRFLGYNWNVRQVEDANDTELINDKIKIAIQKKKKPSLIIVNSHIAYGAPTKHDTASAHGSPLGEDEVRGAKIFYGWDPDKHFFVPDEVNEYTKSNIEKGNKTEEEWNNLFKKYEKAYPDLAKEFLMMQNGELPDGWDSELPIFPVNSKPISGRKASNKVLNEIAKKIPWIIGGAGDLAPSTLTLLENTSSIEKNKFEGRNLHYGIRENAMTAITSGIALSKLKAFASTFFVFTDYMKPSIRLAALMKLPVIYVLTHDSIGLGEDGPTHQPIEHLAALRAMPCIEVIRPADANEVSVLWKYIINLKNKPAALILTRQDLPVIDRNKYLSADGALKGGYVLADCEGMPEIILIATGSEVYLCIDAYEQLKNDGIKARVVSLPCWSLFDKQPAEYRESVLPKNVKKRIAVEAGSTFGWSHYTGNDNNGRVIGMKTFGASANYKDLYKEFGITVEAIIKTSKELLLKNRK
jgi:transketolase